MTSYTARDNDNIKYLKLDISYLFLQKDLQVYDRNNKEKLNKKL